MCKRGIRQGNREVKENEKKLHYKAQLKDITIPKRKQVSRYRYFNGKKYFAAGREPLFVIHFSPLTNLHFEVVKIVGPSHHGLCNTLSVD